MSPEVSLQLAEAGAPPLSLAPLLLLSRGNVNPVYAHDFSVGVLATLAAVLNLRGSVPAGKQACGLCCKYLHVVYSIALACHACK